MNLTLTYCWKEWRAQRAVLLAFTGMGLAALCLGFLLAPAHFWLEDGRRALVLSWFTAIGVIGVVAFVAPTLVRGEFGTKDDQFVRRLPGALLPSFGGKLLFFVLAAAALPLATLLAGEGFLLALGQPWHDLFTWSHDGSVVFVWPWPAPMLGAAMLLATWVWAIGTWLPGGRMAIGGVVLFVLVLGLGVVALLRQSPNIEKGLDWWSWLWTVPVLGVAVAATSWIRGRRGGGPLRSARFGLATAAAGLAAPSAWFGVRAWDYHHPDPQRFAALAVSGLTSDGRFALAHGAAQDEFRSVPFRIDLADGTAEQLGGIECHASLAADQRFGSGLQRYWRLDQYERWDADADARLVLDLQTGDRVRYGWDMRHGPVWPAALAGAIASEQRNNAPLRGPDGVRVWLDGDQLVFAASDGKEQRMPWTFGVPSYLRPAGHAVEVLRNEQRVLFDLTRREPVRIPNWGWGWFARGRAVFRQAVDRSGQWWTWDGAEARPFDAIRGVTVIGLADDEHLLCWRFTKGQLPRVFLLRVADGTTTELPLPAAVPKGTYSIQYLGPLGNDGSLLTRDPAGRIWLSAGSGREGVILRLDPAARTLAMAMRHDTTSDSRGARWQLLAWLDANTALVRDDTTIQRVDVATGARTQLFPRR